MNAVTSAASSIAKAMIAGIGLAAAGCAVGEAPIEGAGLSCVDDSPRCISERQATLNRYVSDPQRRWVKDTPSSAAYASGVRMFAFKTTKKQLTCEELAHGRREAEGAATSLKGAGSTLTPAQVSRSTMFASEVGRELSNEMKKRCNKG